MNYFPEGYFPFLPQKMAQYQQANLNTNSVEIQNQQKYIALLEKDNKLLRDRLEEMEIRLRLLEDTDKSSGGSHQKKSEAFKDEPDYKCIYHQCDRIYKSSLALNLHIKTKHNGGSIRQRQAYAKLIIQNQKQGRPRPKININFPPNFLQNYRKKLEKAQKFMRQSEKEQ